MLAFGIAIATVVAFILSSTFYAVAPTRVTASTGEAPYDGEAPHDGERTRPWQVAAELVRSALVSCLIAGLLVAGGWRGPAEGALLGIALWVLPLVLLAGSVVWERVPMRSAGLHAADWFLKLIVIGGIVGLFT